MRGGVQTDIPASEETTDLFVQDRDHIPTVVSPSQGNVIANVLPHNPSIHHDNIIGGSSSALLCGNVEMNSVCIAGHDLHFTPSINNDHNVVESRELICESMAGTNDGDVEKGSAEEGYEERE